jgi:hypothetical protein
MALIDCPECGARVSDAAPACPKCGFPIAAHKAQPTPVAEPDVASAAPSLAASPTASPTASTATESAAASSEPPLLSTERSAEPFRIAGRRVPIAAVLFWGGMVLGLILKAFAGEDGVTPYRYVPITMILLGVLWFSVTEFTMIIRHRMRR